MSTTDLRDLGYRYDGESVEVLGPITEEQHQAISEALGVTGELGEYDPDRSAYTLRPAGPEQVEALRGYLRQHGISHANERRDAWASGSEMSAPPDANETALAELIALAEQRGVDAAQFEDRVHEFAARTSAEINDAGVAAQIGYLVATLGAATTRRILEAELRED